MRLTLPALLIALTIVSSGAAAAPGAEPGPVSAADGRALVSLVTDVTSAIPGGPFWVGLRFQLAPGWHLYWKNPGQSGMATEVEWSGEGITAGPTRWPTPERITSSDGFIVTYGWHGDVVLLSEARTTTGGTIKAVADFLVCEVECIPGHVELSRRIEAGDGGPAAEDVRGVMAASWARVPRPASEHGLSVSVVHEPSPVPPGAAFTTTVLATSTTSDPIALPERGPEHAFFPERTPTVTLMPRQPAASGVGVVLAGTTSADDPGGDQQIAGVLVLERKGAPLYVEVAAPLPRGGAVPAPTAAPTDAPAPSAPAAAPTIDAAPLAPALGLGEMLLFAFLGGLILNLMPCVLPVLAIKVGGLVRLAGESTADRARHAAAYTAGIVASLLVLAVAVLALRLGWGSQFQSPEFLVVVGSLLIVLAVNAFGGLEIGVGADGLSRAVDARSGLARSAGEGVLAVVLATPCSAPFLGSSIGAALVSPAPVVLLAFATLGLGLAAPVALLSIAPGLRRFVPKPGPWMMRLKQAVGFALIAAAIWLAWILGRGFGIDATAGVLAFWLALAIGAWIVGAGAGASARRRIVGAVVAIALVAATGALALRFDRDAASTARAARLGAGWEPWSEDAVVAHLAAGRPVFVDFTADWCLTCKVNERTVLDTETVHAAVAATNTALLKGDWTLRDEAIQAVLTRHGKAGVPLYLVYAPASPRTPEVLPEVLTPSLVVDALQAATQR